MGKTLADAIASYGQDYRKRYLIYIDPHKLLSDFWAALDFFLSKACFQGRLDQVSDKVYKAVIEVLEQEFSVSSQVANYHICRQQEWKPLEKALRSRVGKGHVGKARDVDMVLSTLDFLSQLSDLNIVRYSVEQIKQGRLGKHCAELQGANGGITQIGPKVAGLYLRDLVALYELDGNVSADIAYSIQPVDTWVRKLAYRLGIAGKGTNDDEVQKAIVEFCKSQGISPVLFNQGAWYVGYYAYDIVLKLLDTEE